MSQAKNSRDGATTLRFRADDSPSGITRATWQKVAALHGLNETDAIHLALVDFARKTGVEMKKLKTDQQQLPFDPAKFDLGGLSGFLRKVDANWVKNKESQPSGGSEVP